MFEHRSNKSHRRRWKNPFVFSIALMEIANALVLYSVTLYGFSGILAFLKISNFEIAITFDLSVVESPDPAQTFCWGLGSSKNTFSARKIWFIRVFRSIFAKLVFRYFSIFEN